MSTKEQEVAKLKENIEELKRNVESEQREKEKLHETLQQQYQEEKDQIVEVCGQWLIVVNSARICQKTKDEDFWP